MGGCSDPSDVQPFPGHCGVFEIVDVTPADMALDVPTNTPIDLIFSDYPDPDSLGGSSGLSLVLTTGVFYYTGTYSVDLIDKRVRFRTPSPLRPFLGYSLNLTGMLRSLQGCSTMPRQTSFETGGGTSPAAAVPPATTFDQILPLFAHSCGGSACHRQSESHGGGCLDAPASGLSLCDAEAYDALVGVPARQLSRLQRVAAHDASRSYLLRKLLPSSSDDPANAPPVPTTLGHRDPPGAPLPPDDLRAIANWIDSGASH
ncbi:MAG: hypothetical protein QOI66_5337 [Myxococcales bacterium]|nr:hypothetical protein [Myxococcales bacterium]